MNADLFNSLFDSASPPSVAIVAAHPDDEVIGAGAQLRRWPKVSIIHVTDGSPLNSTDAWDAGFVTCEDYASARQRESMAALALAGVDSTQFHPVAFPDQEASLNLRGLTEALVRKFTELQSEIIITHAYEGGHPDHDATAFGVRAAKKILMDDFGFAPEIIEMTSYFNRAGIMATGEFLPRARCRIRSFELSESEREFKRRLFACFKTQRNVLQYFPIGVERFRIAPEYDFTRPPHPGRLFYEQFDWGISGAQWRILAREALGKKHRAPARQTARAEHFSAAFQN
ncbi:MAG TPA: PIG-L family deacetylase [Verrucomicrobiae bacterium]|nr:PIG-L family deacetylase [Verrucomicrobiae bacterium]